MYRCKWCDTPLGWDRPSGVCSIECLKSAQAFSEPKTEPVIVLPVEWLASDDAITEIPPAEMVEIDDA